MVRFIKRSPTRFINGAIYLQHIFYCFIIIIGEEMPCFNYADDISILCIHKDYDCADNSLLSDASAMIHLYKHKQIVLKCVK